MSDDGPESDGLLEDRPSYLRRSMDCGATGEYDTTTSSVSTIEGAEIAPSEDEDPWVLTDLQDNSPKWSGGYILTVMSTI